MIAKPFVSLRSMLVAALIGLFVLCLTAGATLAAPVRYGDNYFAVQHGIVQVLLQRLLAGLVDSQYDDDYYY